MRQQIHEGLGSRFCSTPQPHASCHILVCCIHAVMPCCTRTLSPLVCESEVGDYSFPKQLSRPDSLECCSTITAHELPAIMVQLRELEKAGNNDCVDKVSEVQIRCAFAVDPRRGQVTRIMRPVPPPAPPTAPPPPHYVGGGPTYQQQQQQQPQPPAFGVAPPHFGYVSQAQAGWTQQQQQQQQQQQYQPLAAFPPSSAALPNPPPMPLSFGMTGGTTATAVPPVRGYSAGSKPGAGNQSSGTGLSGTPYSAPSSGMPASSLPAVAAAPFDLAAILRNAGVLMPGSDATATLQQPSLNSAPFATSATAVSISQGAANDAADNVDISNDLFALLGQLASGPN